MIDPPSPSPRPLVIVAEDEFLIGEVLEDAITNAGYEVLRANDGIEGVELLIAHPELAGLVTDIRLERGADGWSLAGLARQLNRRAAVVYVTGDSAANWSRYGVPGSEIVQKPFRPADVVAALQRQLSEPASLPPMPAPTMRQPGAGAGS